MLVFYLLQCVANDELLWMFEEEKDGLTLLQLERMHSERMRGAGYALGGVYPYDIQQPATVLIFSSMKERYGRDPACKRILEAFVRGFHEEWSPGERFACIMEELSQSDEHRQERLIQFSKDPEGRFLFITHEFGRQCGRSRKKYDDMRNVQREKERKQ